METFWGPGAGSTMVVMHAAADELDRESGLDIYLGRRGPFSLHLDLPLPPRRKPRSRRDVRALRDASHWLPQAGTARILFNVPSKLQEMTSVQKGHEDAED